MTPITNSSSNSTKQTPGLGRLNWLIALIWMILMILASCDSPPPATPQATPLPSNSSEPLILYDWPEDIPQSILDAFQAEFGIEVIYLTYESQEQAVQNMRQGEVYDVVVVENQFIPGLVAEGLLAEINLDNVPNFSHIAPNFKDLDYDPSNRYSVPFNWGTTGLIIHQDWVKEPVTGWADLWNPDYAGQVAIRDTPREIISLTLKSLGFSANSEDPDELELALERLLELPPSTVIVEGYAEDAVPLLVEGEVILLVGWAEDVMTSREENLAVDYVSPEEGFLLWGDNFVIPANSSHQDTAQLFIDFLLRPDISAQITNENY
jgi:spermidine/putrescine transport system substrate-binding protein